MGRFFVWAHRGASALAPENTLAAFRVAEEAGADGLELDVQMSRDGVPVVLHDDTVDRTTDGQGAVAALSLAELRQLDAGTWFDAAFAEERIPTLEEALAWGAGRLRFNLEIKDSAAGLAVLELAGRYEQAAIIVSSFDHTLLAMLHRKAPSLPLAFLWEQPDWAAAVEEAAVCKAESFHPFFDVLTAEMVAACHRHGMAVYPWTVDDPAALEQCRRLAVDGIFCNHPARVVSWRQGAPF